MMDCGSNVMASPGTDSSSGSSEAAAAAPGSETSQSSSSTTQHQGQAPSGDGICAVLSSKGGVISVRGLDGNARVSSGGGAVLVSCLPSKVAPNVVLSQEFCLLSTSRRSARNRRIDLTILWWSDEFRLAVVLFW